MTRATLYSADTLCPFTHRALVTAEILQSDLAVVYGADIPDAVRQANEGGQWPQLVTAEGETLADSRAIVEYLIEGAGERGAAFRCDPAVLDLLDRVVQSMSMVIHAGKPKVQQQQRAALDAALAEVDATLQAAGGRHLAGAEFSQAEAHIVPFLHRMPFVAEIRIHCPKPLRDSPGLRDWIDRTVTHAAYQRVAPQVRALRAFYEQRTTYGKPMKIGRLHHSGFRGMWDDMQQRVERAASEGIEADALAEARGLAVLLFRAVALHAKFENLALFPTLDDAKGEAGFTASATEDHTHEADVMTAILQRFAEARDADGAARSDALQHLARSVVEARQSFFDHLAYEEANFFPVLSELDRETHIRLLKEAYAMCLVERPYLIGVVVAYMPRGNALSFVDSLSQAVEPDHPQWRLVMGKLHQTLDPELWLRIQQRFEDIIPTTLALLPAGQRLTLAEMARQLETDHPVDRIEIPTR